MTTARRTLVAVVGLMLTLTAPAAAQVDLGQQVEVDRIMRALADNMPIRGATILSSIAPSDVFYVEAAGDQVRVTTRFLREASRDALAAWVATSLLPDPVFAAITLHRAGFDGARGLAELQQRAVTLLSWQARARQDAHAARDWYHAEVNGLVAAAVSLPGYQVMIKGVVDQTYARHASTVNRYLAFNADLPRAYALPMVSTELIAALHDITTVLRGLQPPELSPWGERIRDVLIFYDGPKVQ